MTRCFPSHTSETNAFEAVIDLQDGVGILIEHMDAVVRSFSEEEYGTDIVKEMSPVFWIALRLQNDIEDVIRKVEALPKPVIAVAA
jgi:hypothetical protein